MIDWKQILAHSRGQNNYSCRIDIRRFICKVWYLLLQENQNLY